MVAGKRDELALLHTVLDGGWVKDWVLAVDGGANIGDWSNVMAPRFTQVIAFEPVPESVALFKQNVTAHNVTLREEALYDREILVRELQPANRTSLRSRFVMPHKTGTIKAVDLDSLHLMHCGLLKLDLEGAEHLAILGAVETISRCRPVIIAELRKFGVRYGYKDEETVALIEGFGYKQIIARDPDLVFAYGDKA